MRLDRLDTQVLARFGEAVKPPVRPPLKEEQAQALEALVMRRRQLVAGTNWIVPRLPLRRKCITPWRLCMSLTRNPHSSSRRMPDSGEELLLRLVALRRSVRPYFFAAWFFLLSRRVTITKQAAYCMVVVPAFTGLALFFKSRLFGTATSYSAGTLFLALAMGCLDTIPPALKRLLSVAPLRQFGLWSYSIYLWRQPFYKLKTTIPAYCLVSAIAASSLMSFYFVEQPTREFINRHLSARSTSRISDRYRTTAS